MQQPLATTSDQMTDPAEAFSSSFLLDSETEPMLGRSEPCIGLDTRDDSAKAQTLLKLFNQVSDSQLHSLESRCVLTGMHNRMVAASVSHVQLLSLFELL